MEKSSSIQKKFFNWIFMHEDKNGEKSLQKRMPSLYVWKNLYQPPKQCKGCRR